MKTFLPLLNHLLFSPRRKQLSSAFTQDIQVGFADGPVRPLYSLLASLFQLPIKEYIIRILFPGTNRTITMSSIPNNSSRTIPMNFVEKIFSTVEKNLFRRTLEYTYIQYLTSTVPDRGSQ